jgi:RHS repeat-associated protein
MNVYFDNVQLTHQRGPLVEENAYYPHGLIAAGISSKALNFGKENKYKFNGYELEKNFDLNLYESFYRSHDPQLGRFWQLDPKPSEFESLYAAMGNNSITKTDVLGDTAVVSWGSGFLGLKRHRARYVNGAWIDSKSRKSIDMESVSSKRAVSLMKDYKEIDDNSNFDKLADKINSTTVNVEISAGKKGETDAGGKFRRAKNTETIKVRLPESQTLHGNLNENGRAIELNQKTIMSHELGHVIDILNSRPESFFQTTASTYSVYGVKMGIIITSASSEINAMYWENVMRAQQGMPLRIMYLWSPRSGAQYRNNDALITKQPGEKCVKIQDLEGNSTDVNR